MDYATRIGHGSTYTLYLKESVKRKECLFEKITSNPQTDVLLKYLIRHLYGRLEFYRKRIKEVEMYLEISNNIFMASVDQNMSVYTNKLNQTMQIFASIATMFLPLQLVSGLFGMNVLVPGQNIDHEWPFYLICGVCILLLAICFIYFKCKRWL